MPASENALSRVKVALLVSSATGRTPTINQRFDFNKYSSKESVKMALDADSVEPVSISFPTSSALYAMLDFFNESSFGARPEAQHVIVMVVNGAKPLQINHSDDLKAFNSTDAKLLVVLVGSESNVIYSIFPSNNLVQVTSFNDLIQNQMIPIMLCLDCHSEWFRFKASSDDDAISNISCYRVLYSPEPTNWVQAGEGCLAAESELVSIETKEELSFLRKAVPSRIQEILNLTGDSNTSVDVFIGLTRDSASYSARFRWVNDLPLTYTAWDGGEPLGGHIQRCVVWNFNLTIYAGGNSEDYVSANSVQNRSQYQSEADAWFSVGCGHKTARLFLCESKKAPAFRNGRIARIRRPSEMRMRSAVSRGELGFKTEYTETYGFVTSLVAVSSQTVSSKNLSRFVVFVDHDYENRMSSSNILLFSCQDASRTMIPYALVCDHIQHCQNKRDESICNYRKCDAISEFTCSLGQCVPQEARCDLFPDCADKSDEDKCITCRNGLCHDGRCMPKHWFADGEVDCNACSSRGDVKAEMQSVSDDNIAQCVFTCNRTQCTYTSMLGDGVVDCTGPEGPLDETIGGLESTTCYDQEDNISHIYNNWAPRCVYVKDRYDGLLGCRDLRHLQNCEDFACSEGYVKCPGSYCIPMHYVTNGIYDCPKGEDETVPLDCSGSFKCVQSSICVHPDSVCDGHPHCPQGDDELNCQVSCMPGFSCLGGTVTVSQIDSPTLITDISFIDHRTRYLDLTGVNISSVFPEFPKGHFYNLLEMYLSHCAITHVDSVLYSQNDLRSVIIMTLSYNQIESISMTSIFRYMISLKFLNLSHNEGLTFLHHDTFNTYGTTSALTNLDLSFTNISVLHPDLLVPLINLERLSLRGTKIADMRPNMFPIDFSLHELDLREIKVEFFSSDTFKFIVVKSNIYTDTFKLCCPQLHNVNTPMYACSAPPDPFSSCDDLMSQPILRVLLWLFGCVAVVCNVMVIVYRMVCDRNILKMAYGHFVMHLSISDLFMGVYLLIVAVADAYFRGTYVWNEMEWRNSISCRVAGFLSTLSREVSTFFIFLITVDRFLVIKFPFGQLKMRKSLIVGCCSVAWIVGLGLSVIPLLPPFEYWSTYTSNGMCLGLPLINRRQPGWEFPTIVFVFVNFILFIMIAIGQFIIYRTMASMRLAHGALANISSRRAQDLTVAKHLSLIAITDFMCWFPIGVMGLMSLDGHQLGVDVYAWSTVLILPVNAALNPLIYTIPALSKRWTDFVLKRHRDDSSRTGTRTND